MQHYVMDGSKWMKRQRFIYSEMKAGTKMWLDYFGFIFRMVTKHNMHVHEVTYF